MSFAALAWVMDSAPCPTSQTFAALIVFASFANEHGRSYPSTETVAAKSRQNQKTVRAAIATLQLHGLLVDTGRRVGRTGNVRVYALGMEGLPEVGSLPGEFEPNAAEGAQEASGEPLAEALPETGALPVASKVPVSGSKPSQKRVAEPVREPDPLEEAIASSAPAGRKKGAAAPSSDGSMGRSEGWTAPAIADLPAEVRTIAEQWPAGAYAAYAAGHAAWLAGRRRVADRDKSWHGRIVQLGAQPIQAAKAGLRYEPAAGATEMPSARPTTPAAIARCGTEGEGDLAASLRDALRRASGVPAFTQWLEPCRFDVEEGYGVTVTAPSPFMLSYVRSAYESAISIAAGTILGRHPIITWEAQRAA